MKITRLFVYPIKALRGIPLQHADLGPQGIRYDRRFAIFRVLKNGQLQKMQLSSVPECSLFEQQIISDAIVVRYIAPEEPVRRPDALSQSELKVPLEPDTSNLEKVVANLHGSSASVYKMGPLFDIWFSARFGFDTVLVYIGDGHRPVLGSSMLPPIRSRSQRQRSTWQSDIMSYLTGTSERPAQLPWLTFTDVAPFLVTTEASLRNVSARMSAGHSVDMYRFRPNIVVDGEGEWDEDFWAELLINGRDTLVLTGNCARCTSLNVDYVTGKPAAGELGDVLKKLMKDRRVDKGTKWSPVFGRYGFLAGQEGFGVSVGDEVEVASRREKRSIWDWPGL